ncbi:MAG: RHS repeat-associated core domain-containing protein, partial [Acidobacteriota bacterium]
PVLSDDAPLAHQDFTATPKSGAAAESTTAEDPGGASGDSPQAEAGGCPSSDEAGGASAGAQMAAAHFARSTWPASHGGHGPNARFDSEGAYWSAEGDAVVDGESGSPAEGGPAIPSPVVYYYVWDQVGSVRVVANAAGVIVETHDYSPYGQEIPDATYSARALIHYAGQERDYPSADADDYNNAVDSMHFRSYGALIGRFYKPDNVMGNVYDPQSWNLYSYVEGRPTGFNDPTGHVGGGPPNPPYIAPIGPSMWDTTGAQLMQQGAYQGLLDNGHLAAVLANVGQWVHQADGTWNLALPDGAGGVNTYKPVYQYSWSWSTETATGTLTSILSGFESVAGRTSNSGCGNTEAIGPTLPQDALAGKPYFHPSVYYGAATRDFFKIFFSHLVLTGTGGITVGAAGMLMFGPPGAFAGLVVGGTLGAAANTMIWVDAMRQEATFADGQMPTQSELSRTWDDMEKVAFM